MLSFTQVSLQLDLRLIMSEQGEEPDLDAQASTAQGDEAEGKYLSLYKCVF